MAKKRMFSMNICDSDAFLDMPLSTQCLYFHLNMRADDDGFVDNPKKIMRMLGAAEDDLNVLISRHFILPFESSGVIVIKHWRMHNSLSRNSYTETQYIEEKSMLLLKSNDSYSFTEGEPINDSKIKLLEERRRENREKQRRNNALITQEQRVDNAKVTHADKKREEEKREEKISLDKKREEEQPEAVHVNYQAIVDAFNQTCPSFPRVKNLSDNRRKAIKARLNTYSEADFQVLFEKAEASEFLKGKNSRNWMATFDWLITDSHMAKVLDGNYDAWTSSNAAGGIDWSKV